MSCDMKTPFAGTEGMLSQTEKLTIRNEKSSRLSYSLVNSFKKYTILIMKYIDFQIFLHIPLVKKIIYNTK